MILIIGGVSTVTKQYNSIETPALVLDLDKLEKNIDDIVRYAREAGVEIRPHIKTHKSVNIATRQMEKGAVGITVAKVSEAEVMVEGGIKDVLIAYPLVAESKLKRVKQLMNKAKITVAVDSIEQVNVLNHFFTSEDPLNVWIKVNSGLNRVGVEPNEEVVQLAKHIKELQNLRLSGIFTHAGHSYAATSKMEIERIARDEAEAVVHSAALCEDAGIVITHRSVGSTPTFRFAGKVDGITEIRPGNAVFFDMVQVGLDVATRDQCALKVLSSIVSIKENRIVIDAGSKTLALGQGAHGNASVSGFGYIEEFPDLVIERLSEEHGVIPVQQKVNVKLNDRITIIRNHACVVANLFDSYSVHRNGKIIDKWDVDARGKLQ